MADESDGSRADAVQQFRKALDDDFKAALEDPAHDIVERVRDGTITRAKAEEWALEQGRPPFASKPDPATFEPRGKRNWTLAQMAAWAIWRTDDAVRDVSEDYLCGCVEWVEAKHPRVRFISPVELEFASSTDRVGYKLGSPKVPTAHDVLEDAHHRAFLGGPAPKLSPERAQHEMLDALQAGAPLIARHGEGEAVDRHLWDVLSPFSLGDDPHDALFYPSGKLVRFHRVRVERDAVLAVWPAGRGMVAPVVEPEHVGADASGVITVDGGTEPAEPHMEATPVFPSAGRPSLAHLYKAEHDRRLHSLPVLGSGKEAVYLRSWLLSQVDKGLVDLAGAARPSESAIKKNIQRWRREEKAGSKIGPE